MDNTEIVEESNEINIGPQVQQEPEVSKDEHINKMLTEVSSNELSQDIPQIPETPEVKEFDTVYNTADMQTEIQTPIQNNLPSESQYVMGKLLVSFGTMLICCVLIYIIFKFIKIKKSEKEKKYKDTSAIDSKQIQQSVEKIDNSSAKKRSEIKTPNSIEKCIRTFLERTRNI